MTNAAIEPTSEDLVRNYLNEIGQYALISAGQEIELAKTIEAGAKADGRLAGANGSLSEATRERLRCQVDKAKVAQRMFIESNLRLVVSIARRYQGYGLPLLDLIQDGNIGLIHAVGKYDWRRGFKFSTYATWWIRQAVGRGIADRSRTIRLPAHINEVVNRLRRAEAALAGTLGRDPTDDEVAEDMNLGVERVHEYRRLGLDPVSLSVPVGAEGDTDLSNFLADDDALAPLEEAVRSQSADELQELLGDLDERERRIIELRFGFADGEPQTLEQVGREFSLTRERIRQLEARAIAKLRHPARASTVGSFRD